MFKPSVATVAPSARARMFAQFQRLHTSPTSYTVTPPRKNYLQLEPSPSDAARMPNSTSGQISQGNGSVEGQELKATPEGLGLQLQAMHLSPESAYLESCDTSGYSSVASPLASRRPSGVSFSGLRKSASPSSSPFFGSPAAYNRHISPAISSFLLQVQSVTSSPLVTRGLATAAAAKSDKPTKPRASKKKAKEASEEDVAVPKIKAAKKTEPEPAPKHSPLNPPKHAPTKWQIFLKEYLLEWKESKNPDGGRLDLKAAMHEAAEAYKVLDSIQMEHLTKQARQAKDQYNKEYAKWQASLTPEDIENENEWRRVQRKAGKVVKLMKDPNRPKRPNTPYFAFLEDVRTDPKLRAEVIGDTPVKQFIAVAQLAGAKWRSMSDDEKQVYSDRFQVEQKEYEQKVQNYKKGHSN